MILRPGAIAGQFLFDNHLAARRNFRQSPMNSREDFWWWCQPSPIRQSVRVPATEVPRNHGAEDVNVVRTLRAAPFHSKDIH